MPTDVVATTLPFWSVERSLFASDVMTRLVVVPVTGAYCTALSNNYNGALRPPIVMCSDGTARVVQRRETIDDLLARNCDRPLLSPGGSSG